MSFETTMEKYIKRILYEVRMLFNTSYYSTYYGEVVNTKNYPASVLVKIPELDDIELDCFLTQPFSGKNYTFQLPIENGEHVVISCTAFNLNNPVVIARVPSTLNMLSNNKDEIRIINGSSSIIVTKDYIQLKNGNAELKISKNKMTLNGTSVTCAGENLKHDDIGSM